MKLPRWPGTREGIWISAAEFLPLQPENEKLFHSTGPRVELPFVPGPLLIGNVKGHTS